MTCHLRAPSMDGAPMVARYYLNPIGATMGSKTAYNRQKRLVSGLVNLLDNVERFRWSHADYLRYRAAWFDTDDYKRSRVSDREYLRGIEDAYLRLIWRKVEFSYVVRGKRLPLSSPEYRAVSPQYVNEHCADSGCFVWRDAPDKLWTLPKSDVCEPQTLKS